MAASLVPNASECAGPPPPPPSPPPHLNCGPGTEKNETNNQCEISCGAPTNGRRLDSDTEPPLANVEEIADIGGMVSKVLAAHPSLDAASLEAASLSDEMIRRLSAELASQLFGQPALA